jgi:succinate dehydrogenase flavin-adding protein (antitoxin of CptAB toxin-antitoxin module)
MKNDVEYTGLVDSVKISKKAIKGVEDEKVYKRVGVVKLTMVYGQGDLYALTGSSIADDETYDKISWGARVGKYELNVNDVIAKTKIVSIQKINKDEESKFSIVFETEDLDFISAIGYYVKDKENPSNLKLTYLSSEE